FYRRLDPTPDELKRDGAAYAALLCHPVGHVVKFALEMLTEAQKAGVLDVDGFLAEAPVVFARDNKGNALAALKLVGRVAGRAALARGAFEAAREALRHAKSEVQARALDLLQAHAAQLGPAQLRELADLETFVAASNRAQLMALVGGTGGADQAAVASS